LKLFIITFAYSAIKSQGIVTKFHSVTTRYTRQGSSVDIVTSYMLDDRYWGFHFRRGLGIFLLSTASRLALGSVQPPYPVGAASSFPKNKAAGAWSWPLTSYCRGQECMVLYVHPQYVFMPWCLLKHRI